ncbi:MAG: protein kinase [Planctomycetes bacterium]|nr:protein kinase [Planctomycetota bacterium]
MSTDSISSRWHDAEAYVLERIAAAEQRGSELRLEDLLAVRPDLARQITRAWHDYRAGASALGERTIGDAHEDLRLLDGLTDRYEILRELDTGGMGSVLEVWDHELRRTLAMKIVRRQVDGLDSIVWQRRQSRLKNEAQVLGQLVHPGIVAVHDVGKLTSGEHYFTMQLVRGKTLAAILDERRENRDSGALTTIVGILRRVCETVAYAHSRGVLHRDLKPSNIMVGEFGETYVMDWGLARASDDALRSCEAASPQQPSSRHESDHVRTDRSDTSHSDSGSPLQTMTGDVVGTPSYMAPEQAAGRVEEVDQRSDVYGAGAILYHVLTGHRPYDNGERISGQVALQAVLSGPPHPIPRGRHGPPPELSAICSRAMSRDSHDRYPAMMSMAEDLGAYLEGRIVHAYGDGRWLAFKKWLLRNPALAAGIAIAIVSLALVGALEVRANRALSEQASALRRRVYTNALTFAQRAYERSDAMDMTARLHECASADRGWEWHYLDRLSDRSDACLELPGINPITLYFDRAAARLMTVGRTPNSFEFQAFEWPSLERLHAWKKDVIAHPFAIDAESKRLFWWHGVLDPTTGEELHRGNWSQRWPAFAFSPDRRSILISHSGRLELRDASTRATLAELDRGFFAMSMLAWSPDGKLAFAACRDFDDDKRRGGTVRVYDMRTRQRTHVLRGHSSWVQSVAADPHGAWLASGGWNGEVRLWDLRTGELRRVLDHVGNDHAYVAVSPDGNTLLTAGRSGIHAWDTTTWQRTEQLFGHHHPVMTPVFADDRTVLSTAGRNGRGIRVWNLGASHRLDEIVTSEPDSTRAVSALRGSNRFAVTSSEGTIEIWDGATREKIGDTPIPCRRSFVTFDPDAQRCYATDMTGTVAVWDTRTWRLIIERKIHSAISLSIDVRQRGDLGVTGDVRGRLETWETKQLRPRWSMHIETNGQSAAITQCCFTNDGNKILVVSADGRLRILDADTGRLEANRTLPGGSEGWTHADVIVSPVDNRFATRVLHNPRSWIALWDLDADEPLWSREISGRPVFTSDGIRVLAIGDSLAVLDASDGRVLLRHVVEPATVTTAPSRCDNGIIVYATRTGLRFLDGRSR